jgi:two-component system sensor histidine kinase/response regulator
MRRPDRQRTSSARRPLPRAPNLLSARLAAIVDASADAIVSITLNGVITAWNPAAERLYGYSAAEMVGRPLAALGLPGWDGEIEALLQQLGHGARIENIETERRTKDGFPRDVSLTIAPVRDERGRAVAAIEISRDVTGRNADEADLAASRRLERELREAAERYRTLVDHLPVAVYLQAADERQTALYFSPQLERLTGFRPEEALARPPDWHWIETIHPDDRERVLQEDERTVAAGEPFHMEYRYLRKDGSYVWVLDECVPVRDDTGQVVAWQGVLLDVSARVRAEEAQARLAAIVESADDAIISRTLEGTITSWNGGAERLYGYGAEEATGQSFTILLPYDEDWSKLAALEDFATSPAQFEASRVRKDGTTVDVSITMSPIRDVNGAIVGVSTITRDITERRQLEQELRAALESAEAGIRSKSLFLAMMSHELRTPLQAILGYADLLLLEPADSLTAEQLEDIESIRGGARRMIGLIEQLLDLSRMEAGRLQLADEPVDLGAIIEEARQDVAPQVAAKEIELGIALPPSYPLVRGDRDRLRQIVLNLVGNAVKFTERGLVQIAVCLAPDGVDVVVRDTGIGITAEALPLIFEEFRQVDGSMTRRYGGAGLGLAIARKLANQMGGDISVESTAGVGSSFTLHLTKLDDGMGQMTQAQNGHLTDGGGPRSSYAAR